VSLGRYARHKDMCIEHCSKITANDTHAHDDIADTLYDAIKIGLIEKILTNQIVQHTTKNILTKAMSSYRTITHAKEKRWQL
jgi:hypothetical protein